MNWLTLAICGLAVGLVASLIFIGKRWQLNSKPYWRRPIILAGLLLLGTLAGLLPLKPLDSGQLTTDSDVIFVVDTTYSMNALDGRDGGTRIDDVKKDLRTFAQALGGSRFGIITYEKTATIYLPLTTTYSDVDTAADTLSAGAYLYSTNDPSLSDSLKAAKTYLDKVKAADITRHQVVVLMTDGELTGAIDTPDKVKTAAEQLAQTADATVVIGYGTNNGAKMPEIRMNFSGSGELTRSPYFAQGTVNGKFGEVTSRRDETELRAIASSLRGNYIPAQDIGQATSTITDARKLAADRKAASPESQALRQNILHVPLAICILGWLFVTEVLSLNRVRTFIGTWGKRL
ncbi:MAG TPA: vWA domain-containing protein [Magnetospirillaceae bacterium]|nr:vWA domain-containing protein [Magnetospirillaceae bacterium]